MHLVIDEIEVVVKPYVIVLADTYKHIYPFALKTAMDYRGITQSKLCKNVKGLSQSSVSKFLNGYFNSISESKLIEIMDFLQFPFNFLYKDIKKVNFL
jgi:predicted XRE-type DNA-binding protein